MEYRILQQAAVERPIFGQRKVVPRICVVDGKTHIRAFFKDALEELGYATSECARSGELSAILDANVPDLVIFGLAEGEVTAAGLMHTMAARKFGGRVLVFGPRGAPEVAVVHSLGDELGLAMLPPLFTPFGHESLRSRIAAVLPIEVPQDAPAVDVEEALHAGWLELWYQPKVDARTQALRGVEALARIRHPTWGIVPAAYFIPADGDPHFRALSEFVVTRAVDDWHALSKYGPVEIAINLPVSFLQEPEAIETLCRKMPKHPAFEGMIIEINGTEAVRSLEIVKRAARQLRFHHIAISIDDLGAEWPSLMGLHSFPFVEIKVDRKFVAGCADDRLKQAVCRRILDLADGYGARTVAEGIECRTDLLAAREMEFDLVQGFLFGKPMPIEKFLRTMPQYPGNAPR